MDLNSKKVIVIGAGISGFAAAKLAKKLGADVIMSDANEKVEEKHDLKPLREAGIKIVLGKQTEELFEGAELVIISPAVPRHIPILEKIGQKVPVISEVEFAYKLAKAPIFAVTGTNGKTTTTMLLGELMKTVYGPYNVGCRRQYRHAAVRRMLSYRQGRLYRGGNFQLSDGGFQRIYDEGRCHSERNAGPSGSS